MQTESWCVGLVAVNMSTGANVDMIWNVLLVAGEICGSSYCCTLGCRFPRP